MANSRLYPFWGRLTEALQTGLPQNEAREGRDFFGELYADPDALGEFLEGMAGSMQFVAGPLSMLIPWDRFASFVDVGGASGALAERMLQAHAHLSGTVFDLPPVEPYVAQRAEAGELAERLSFVGGDFFADPLPSADVLLMGHVLHDWDLDEKRALVRSAYAALDDGGVLAVYDAMVDDDRRANVFSLLLSLNMLIETPGGFEYRAADLCEWATEAGFSRTEVIDMPGPDTLVLAHK
jgi:SAM-dependent methyltransferase